MLSIFSLFIVELIAFRWGTARFARLGITQGQPDYRSRTAGFTQPPSECDTTSGHHHVHREKGDEETASSPSDSGPDSMYGQFISIAVLEFGVVLHSVLIGLTLAVDEDFIVLFIVVVFHRQLPSPL